MPVPITYMRSSSHSAHNFCEMRYVAEYALGWSGESNKKADKGTIVHKVMETLALSKKANQEGLKNYFEHELKCDISSDYEAIDVDQLIDQAFAHYSKREDHHRWTKGDLTDCRAWTWKAIEFNDGMYDPRKLDVVDAEPHFDFSMKEDWAKYNFTVKDKQIEGQLGIKGTIDLIHKLSPKVYEIVDWKTGKRLDWATGETKTHDKLRKDFQLKLYHYAARILYPEADNIIVTIFFINDGGPFTLQFGLKDIPNTIELIRKKFETIKNIETPKLTKSWKCSKFCYQGKNTFEGTNVLPIVENRPGQVTEQGQCMTMCEQLNYVLKHRPMESVISNMTAPGFTLDNYVTG